MATLLIAVLAASLLGSMHCVGMCGPLALWASGAGQPHGQSAGPGQPAGAGRATRPGVARRLAGYHLGRLVTYSLAGVAAGSVGALISTGGSWVGVQSLAARLVGGAMIALGIVRLAEWAFPQQMRPAAKTHKPGRIAGWIAARRPALARLPETGRAVAAGSLTTLLPCGWLYLFVLVAAGTGHPLSAWLIMVAFWIGTLPALTALVAGSLRLAPRLGSQLPLAAAALLMLTGLYTATGRAAADLTPLAEQARNVRGSEASQAESDPSIDVAQRTLDTLSGEPLPCCDDGL